MVHLKKSTKSPFLDYHNVEDCWKIQNWKAKIVMAPELFFMLLVILRAIS